MKRSDWRIVISPIIPNNKLQAKIITWGTKRYREGTTWTTTLTETKPANHKETPISSCGIVRFQPLSVDS
jgi:hypothetical protein